MTGTANLQPPKKETNAQRLLSLVRTELRASAQKRGEWKILRLEEITKRQMGMMGRNCPPLNPHFYIAVMIAENTGMPDLQKTEKGMGLIRAFTRKIGDLTALRSLDGMGGYGLLQLEPATYDSLYVKYKPYFTDGKGGIPFSKVKDQLFWGIRAEVALMHSNYLTQYKGNKEKAKILEAVGPEGSSGFVVYMAALHNMGSPVTAHVLKHGNDWEAYIPKVHQEFLQKFRRAHFELTGRKLD